MENVETVIKDALFEILQQGDEAPIEPSEAITAMRYLNRMMFRWKSVGYDLGYTKVSKLSDPVTVPDGAYDGVVTNLALSLAPQYDVTLTQALITNAELGLSAIRVLSFSICGMNYPDTLPIGSGNYNSCDNNFYTGEEIECDTSDIDPTLPDECQYGGGQFN